MAFSKLMQHEIDISRLSDSGGVKKEYIDFALGVKTFVQPLDDEATAMHGLAMGKGWKCYVDPIGIKAGDRVDWVAGGKVFTVIGVSDWGDTTQSKYPHQKVIMSEEKQ